MTDGAFAEASRFKLAMLVQPLGGPADEPGVRYADLITPAGLAELARAVHGVDAGQGVQHGRGGRRPGPSATAGR